MELNFEVVKTYSNDMLDFTHDPDNLFAKFYKDNKYLSNESTEPYMGNFEDDLTFKKKDRKMTAQAISEFGVKNFPQFGSYGWHKTLHTNECKILVPISKRSSNYEYPQLGITQTETNITVTITGPSTITYDYYRIMFRKNQFAYEFVTSKKVLTIPKLPVGEYEVSAIGYKDGDIVSKETVAVQVIL